MAKSVTTWVLVADGARAKAFVNTGPGDGLAATPDLDLTGSRAQVQDMVSDRGGRQTNVPGGAAHHGLSPRIDPRQTVEKEFMRTVADALAAAAARRAYDRLVVCAAPHALGDLRALMPDAVRTRVIAEVDRDYVHLAPHALVEHLKDVVAL